MQKRFLVQKAWKKPSLLIGALLLATLIGVSGCGSTTASSSNSDQSTTQSQSTQGQTSQGQATQTKRTINPAQQAAMEIRRLENSQQNPLTSDQKTKLKPILQELIKTTSPSQDFLQQQADAINAVFTDQQKTELKSAPQRPSKGSNQNTNSQSQTQNNQSGNTNGSNSQRRAGGQRGTFNPQQFYQQVLDSLNK
ncbi:hypothetical protein DEAC_c25250 [Desulfosporosinus acididurans]|uniref:Lipoprotein n=1 Tax=Desulfosporosinus acididurans TaxID=476652 RepID=A0A0J1FQY3_9FIRM|nr:hypothetical protein [Desulfosporosinus acididurans]KLU65388.1 hypothetical protein DEAC_c25250 [Desulfosporosinus acididurans]